MGMAELVGRRTHGSHIWPDCIITRIEMFSACEGPRSLVDGAVESVSGNSVLSQDEDLSNARRLGADL